MCERLTDSGCVSLEREQFLAGRCVPDLYKPFVCSHGHVIPLSNKKQSVRYLQTSGRRLDGDGNQFRVALTRSDQPTDVTESPSTDRSHSRVTCTKESCKSPKKNKQIQNHAREILRGATTYLARAGAPQVNAGPQSHAQHV